jgi:hypothetical protein
MRFVWFSVLLILLVSVTSFGQNTFYYPHIVNGDLGGGLVWKTTIFLTNPAAVGTSTASGTILFMKDNPANPGAPGNPFTSISFVDENNNPVGSGNSISFQIAGGETRKYTSTGEGTYATANQPNSPGGGGFAIVDSNVPITGTAVFSLFNNGTLIGEAGVPAGVAVPRQVIFVDTIADYKVGVAMANVGATAANVTLNLLNTSAQTVATTTLSGGLGANDHVAKFTFEFFPAAQPLAGTMQIVSDAPLSVIALRFDPSFSIFTTLPPVTIASMLQPAVQWFRERPWAAPLVSIARLLGALQFHMA